MKIKCLVSDRDSCFTYKDFNIKHIKIATGSPQANEQVECISRNLYPMFAILTEPRN